MAKALLRTQANAEAGRWEGPLPAHSPFIHPQAQAFTPPENVMDGDRPSSHSDDDMRTGALYHNHQHPNSQQVRTSMRPDGCMHERVLLQPYLCHTDFQIELVFVCVSPAKHTTFWRAIFLEKVTNQCTKLCDRKIWVWKNRSREPRGCSCPEASPKK